MTDSLAAELSELVTSSSESDYAKDGFHQRHSAEPANVSKLARAYLANGYWLEMLTCEDRRFDDIGKLRLVYCFNRLEACDRHVVFVEVEVEQELASITEVYAAANWFEREVFEMYGVRFAEHPNLKQLLLPEDADFHALLKDFGRIEDAEAGEGEEGAQT